jgi:hypothetical protein
LSHSAAGQKAFSLKTANAAPEEATRLDDGDGDEPVDPQRKPGVTGREKVTGKRKRPDNPGFKDPVAHELDEDIAKAKSCTILLYVPKAVFTVLLSNVVVLIVEPGGIANPYAYENMMWYPG